MSNTSRKKNTAAKDEVLRFLHERRVRLPWTPAVLRAVNLYSCQISSTRQFPGWGVFSISTVLIVEKY